MSKHSLHPRGAKKKQRITQIRARKRECLEREVHSHVGDAFTAVLAIGLCMAG